MEEIDTLAKTIDELIKQNRHQTARQLLIKARPSKLPRGYLVKFASLCRRCQLNNLSLKILNLVVRSEKELDEPATDDEKAEYAVTLQRVGSNNEAVELLNQIDRNKVPQANLYMAFSFFSQWEYQQAIPFLKTYIMDPKINSYQALVGRVNLAAALLATGDFTEASELLGQIKNETLANNHLLLHMNSLELLAQIAFLKNDFVYSKKLLTEAQNFGAEQKTDLTAIFVKKWRLIIDGIESNNSNGLRQMQEAEKNKNSEIFRDLDYYIFKIDQNLNLGIKLLCGTPFSIYRNRIYPLIPPNTLARDYLFSEHFFPTNNIKTIGDPLGLDLFKTGSLIPSVLLAITEDFYRGIRVGSLFAKLYPDEYFNPYSSPAKIHQLVNRTNLLLRDLRWPIKIFHQGQYYHSNITSSEFGLKLKVDRPVINPAHLRFFAFKEKLGKAKFTSKEMSHLMQITPSAANKLITQWNQNAWVDHFGEGIHRTYYFKNIA